MHKLKLALIILFTFILLGCDNPKKEAPNVLALRDLPGLHVNKVIWGPEYSYWNPVICFGGDCPVKTWTWCVQLQAESKYDAINGFKSMYSQKLQAINPGWYKYITRPSSDILEQSRRSKFLETYNSERKLYENDFGIYLYKLAEAKTKEETKVVENEIAQKLMSGVALKVEYRRGKKRAQWFYVSSGLEYGKRACQ